MQDELEYCDYKCFKTHIMRDTLLTLLGFFIGVLLTLMWR